MSIGLYSFTGEFSVDYVGLTAAASISVLPIIVVFIVFQGQFVEGIAGSVKG